MELHVKMAYFCERDGRREIHTKLNNGAKIVITRYEQSYMQSGGTTEEKGASVGLADIFWKWLIGQTDDPTDSFLLDKDSDEE